jgi:hypothetical protein
MIEKCLNHLEQSKIKRTYQRAIRQQEQDLARTGRAPHAPGADVSNIVPLRPAPARLAS